MKKSIIYSLLLALLWACNEPGPTELVIDYNSTEDKFDIEILSPEPSQVVYSNGYDSTGILPDLPQRTSIVSISGIKTSYGNYSRHQVFNAAIFLDKSQAVQHPHGKILGYKSIVPGNVKFNNEKAKIRIRNIGYRYENEIIDTTLGYIYVLSGNRNDNQYGLRFDYDSYVKFDLIFFSSLHRNPVELYIPTPVEITGKVKLEGSREEKNLKFVFEWNKQTGGFIEIIVGGELKNRGGTLPLFRLTARDNGKLRLPLSLAGSIPFDKFDRMVVTFKRSLEKTYQNDNLSDNYIIANSIHNIIFDAP